jgi:hypothetical protein
METSKLLSLEVSKFLSFFLTYSGFLEQVKRDTSEIITKIRSNADTTENQRRIVEEKMRKERAKKIQTEVIISHKKNVEIDWTWQELEEKEDCEELAKVSERFISGHRSAEGGLQTNYYPEGRTHQVVHGATQSQGRGVRQGH